MPQRADGAPDAEDASHAADAGRGPDPARPGAAPVLAVEHAQKSFGAVQALVDG